MDFDFFKIHTLFWVKKHVETAISSYREQKMHPPGYFLLQMQQDTQK